MIGEMLTSFIFGGIITTYTLFYFLPEIIGKQLKWEQIKCYVCKKNVKKFNYHYSDLNLYLDHKTKKVCKQKSIKIINGVYVCKNCCREDTCKHKKGGK